MNHAADTDDTEAAAGPLLEVRGVNLSLRGQPILQNVDLTLHAGQILSLIGLNGSGKTTLLRVILGLLKADSGRVWRRPGLRVGYMPQRLTVDPTLPLTVYRFMRLAAPAGREKIRTTLAQTAAAGLLDTPVQALSGGEFQRVMLARALLREPDLLVLDEPVQAVDLAGQYALYELIGQIRQRYGCGILLVSHDLHLVMPATDRVICMNHHVCCAGSPEQVSRDPAFLALFGPERARHVAVYRHHHDHRHNAHGDVVHVDPPDKTDRSHKP